jgi:hypothetical protein
MKNCGFRIVSLCSCGLVDVLRYLKLYFKLPLSAETQLKPQMSTAGASHCLTRPLASSNNNHFVSF